MKSDLPGKVAPGNNSRMVAKTDSAYQKRYQDYSVWCRKSGFEPAPFEVWQKITEHIQTQLAK